MIAKDDWKLHPRPNHSCAMDAPTTGPRGPPTTVRTVTCSTICTYARTLPVTHSTGTSNLLTYYGTVILLRV